MKKITVLLALIGAIIYFTGCKKNNSDSLAGTFYGNQATLGNGTVRSYIP